MQNSPDSPIPEIDFGSRKLYFTTIFSRNIKLCSYYVICQVYRSQRRGKSI
jgi:hypothetical protein